MVDKTRNRSAFQLLEEPTSNVVDAKPSFGIRALSALVSRLGLANRAGIQFDGARDLYSVFGYKKVLKPEDVLAKYVRQDIASRIVDAPPGATWSNPPEMIADASIISKWDEIVESLDLWNVMQRADRLARMYPFSVVVLGYDRGALHSRARKASELMYARAYGMRQVTEIKYEANKRDPRYGLPVTYKIEFDDLESRSTQTALAGAVRGNRGSMVVHYSRLIHVVENPLDDLVFGYPIMEKVFNLLDDLLKVSGGTAETYWLTSNRGMQADIDKEMDLNPTDAAELSDEIDEYMHQLRRVIRTRGVDLKVLDSTTPSPEQTFKMIINLISGTTGIPTRILLGAEVGQLASEQDRANWAERIDERNTLFATPQILKPTTKSLQNVGLLPTGPIGWLWPSAFVQNPLEKGQTMAQTARAIGNISRQTGNQTPMPVVTLKEARTILGLPEEMDPTDKQELMDFMTTPERDDGVESEEDIDEGREDDTADE